MDLGGKIEQITQGIAMDQLDDIFNDGAVKKARPTGKFQPKAKPKPPKKNSAAASVVPSSTVVQASGVVPSSEAVPVNVPNTENIGLASDIPVKDSIHTNNASEVLTSNPELLEEGGPATAGQGNDGGVTITNKECEREEMYVKDSNISELTTTPAQRTGKKPCLASTKSVSSTLLPPEVNLSEKNSLHDDVVNDSSIGWPTVETSEIPVNVESMNLMETAQLDSGCHLEGVTEVPAKLVSRRAKKGKHKAQAALDSSLHQKNGCTSSQENETGRSLRPRKRKASFLEFDEAEDDAAVNDLSDELPYIPAVGEGDDDEQIQQETEPKTKKSRGKKSKKPDNDKEKRAKKQKKGKEVSAQGADVKPKKFKRSTKRKREVDPSLLNTDHEFLDMRTIPMKDVIRFGEHLERQAKKDKVAVKPATKPSNANSPAPYNGEDEPFTYGEGEEVNDEQENPVIEESSLLVNYHTYMDRPPTIRWSKQDTELFYKGVREFGADLSMIQQLFPSRTRHQIKLKYKKEEKQHPLMLRDALTNRTQNFSHYELLIERFKQMAEEKENADKDESIDLTGEDMAEEGTYHADDEEADENKQFEEESKEDVAHDVVQESTDPVEEAYDSEEDNLLWSQYKSDI